MVETLKNIGSVWIDLLNGFAKKTPGIPQKMGAWNPQQALEALQNCYFATFPAIAGRCGMIWASKGNSNQAVLYIFCRPCMARKELHYV